MMQTRSPRTDKSFKIVNHRLLDEPLHVFFDELDVLRVGLIRRLHVLV
jgi:hypothetical protein